MLIQPAIEIGPPLDWSDVDQAIHSLADFDAIVFCSHNGVHYFLNRLTELGKDVRALAGIQIAAVGSKTADSLAEFHLRADIVPVDFRAEALADQMASQAPGKRILIVRASRGKDVLADTLAAAGARVRQLVAYSHQDVTEADPNIARTCTSRKDRLGHGHKQRDRRES